MVRLTRSARDLAFRLGFVAVLLGAGFLATEPACADEENLTDHLTLLGDLSRVAAKDLLDQLEFPSGSDVYLFAETDHPANWFVAQQLARVLREAGCGVIQPTLGTGVGEAQSQSTQRNQGARSAQTGSSGGQARNGAGQQAQQESNVGADPDSVGTDEDDGFDGSGGDDADTDEDSSSEPGDQEGGQPQAQESGNGNQDSQGQGGRNQAQGQGGQNQANTQQAAGQSPDSRILPKELTLNFPPDGEMCVFRVVECGVNYPWVHRSWLVGSQTYGRYASVKLRGSRVRQPGKRVVSVGSSDQVSIDKFPGWARPYLEGSEYPFPIERPAGMAMERLVEPVIVVAIVGGLVYLFNQNQK